MKPITIIIILFYYALIQSLIWIFFPKVPMVMQEPLEILNENKTVRVGEALYYRAIFKKYVNVYPEITRTLVDTITYTLAESYPKNDIGDYNQPLVLIIPKFLPEGNYYFKTKACYDVNPIRMGIFAVCVNYSSEKFKVVK